MDFGALLAEQASAARLMMTVAQIVKHIDGSVPVRFLIAETETRLHAARRAVAGAAVRHREACRDQPAVRDGGARWNTARACWRRRCAARITAPICKRHGRLALQFGYSDSGRYVGQLAASYLIERLRLKIGRDAGRASASPASR